MQTHHCYYRYYPDGLNAVPWDYPDDSLITLREKCHRDEERMIKPTKADLIAAMAERGASSKDFRKLAAAFRAVKLEKDVKYLVDVISKWMKQESALEHMVKVYEDAEARKKTKVIAKNGRR